jgi:hypothetical protein
MNDQLIVSYLTLRKAIGYIAILIPFILVLGSVVLGNCTEVQSSISDYYHTVMRDGLVGCICAISFFLYTYRGYDDKDFWATRLAATFALLVAFFPTVYTDEVVIPCNMVRELDNGLINTIHFSSALLFFLTLAYISLFLFTKSDTAISQLSAPKKSRNRIYRVSGYLMLGCLVVLALYFGWLRYEFPGLKPYDPVFWLESIALWAFGFSWLTKGEVFYRDRPEESQSEED